MLLFLYFLPYTAMGALLSETFQSRDNQTKVPYILSKPAGSGPFPAVVLTHGCGGLTDSVKKSLKSHARYLNEKGFVTLIMDNFSPRGRQNHCAEGQEASRILNRLMRPRMLDAYGAIDFLRTIDYVGDMPIGFVGQSYAGILALTLASERREKFAETADPFSAAVAFYPTCSFRYDRFLMPALVLIGENDDWTPPATCPRLEGKGKTDDIPVDVVIYPDTYHSFDVPLRRSVKYRGHVLQQNRRATEDARQRMGAFFERHLKE